MTLEATHGPAQRLSGETATAWRATVDRLVLEVSAAVDDGTSGVPESQRLLAYLSGEILPGLGAIPSKGEHVRELIDVVYSLQGTNGVVASDLAWQARAIVMSAT